MSDIPNADFASCTEDINAIVNAAVRAVDPARIIKKSLRLSGNQLNFGEIRHDISRGRLFLISVGKAAVPMAAAAATIAGDFLHSGIIITKQFAGERAARSPHPALVVHHAAHPVADKRSVAAATAVLNLLAQTNEEDLVLFLISGGASALISKPALPLPEWQQLNERLLASGCTIQEFNTIRRQLDQVKGGGLAAAAAPARCVSLILSDVIGNDLATIGSGPTFFSGETPEAALAVLTKYRILSQLPEELGSNLKALLEGDPAPTAVPSRNEHLIIGDVRHAAAAAAAAAEQRGFHTRILTTHLEGESREAGKFAAALARDLAAGECLILGGETTVTVKGDGVGGRNTELALAAAVALSGVPGRVIATFATDGDDGPTSAAGGIVTGETISRGTALGCDAADYLRRNDSYSYLKRVDTAVPSLILTGPTGSNVNDLIFILHYPSEQSKIKN